MARPSKFKPEMVERVVGLAACGATDLDIAGELGVSRATLSTWKRDNPEFLDSLKAGKHLADSRVEKSLFNRAVGFTDPTGLYHPPHPVAAIFWLKNRKPQEWRDTTRNEITGPDGQPVALQGPPRPSAEEVATFAAELHEGFASYRDEATGEPPDLAEAMPMLGEVVAGFAAGEDNPANRSARETGGFLASIQFVRRKLVPPRL